jgi:hypothetical protein
MFDRASSRQRRGLTLAVLASFGLVVAPLLHAELHAHEAEAEGVMNGLVERLAMRGGDFDEVFAQVWQLGHGKAPLQHSHGPVPASQEQHGAGTLEHFALALHAAPPVLAAPPPVPQPAGRQAEPPARVPLEPWRLPASSQGPPLA